MRRGRQPVFRIFVSSTFADLKAERNILQEQVFPRLQKLCERHGCRFQAIDLRWGVSEEAGRDQQTMNICLTELRRCQNVSPRPNFIILLGDRYGWMPLPPQIEASEFEAILSKLDSSERAILKWDEAVEDGGSGWYRLDTNAVPAEYVLRPRREEVHSEKDCDSWGKTELHLRQLLLKGIDRLGWADDDVRRVKYERSATHQEITEGALKLPDEREHVFAFLRDIGNLDDLPAGSEYVDGGYSQARALKDAIRQTRGITSFSYDAVWHENELRVNVRRLAADVLRSLKRIIREELRQIERVDDLTRENEAHADFGENRGKHFIGRSEYLDRIAEYLQGMSSYPLILYGPSGSGKSALMAKAAQHAVSISVGAPVICRFVGATPESTDVRSLIRNLCLEISRTYGFEQMKAQGLAEVESRASEEASKQREEIEKKYDVPHEYRHLVETFRNYLSMIPHDRKLILFLDALDQLNDSENAHSLYWLPREHSTNVRIVASVLERDDAAGTCLRSAQAKYPLESLIRLESLSQADGREILNNWLNGAYPERKRTLTGLQMANVMDGFQVTPNPLYLKLAFEEAWRWKSYDGLPRTNELSADLAEDTGGVFSDVLTPVKEPKQLYLNLTLEQIGQRTTESEKSERHKDVIGLPRDLPGLVRFLLSRLTSPKQHGEALVTKFLGLLSASRHGLSETEILDLLSSDADVMAALRARSARSPEATGVPMVVWLRLYYDLVPYIVERSADRTVLVAFYHREVEAIVKRTYHSPNYYSTLARYFMGKADPDGELRWKSANNHCLAELPYQLSNSESMWADLERTLTSAHFIDAKCKAGLIYDLVSDFARAEWVWPSQSLERQIVAESQRRVSFYIERLIKYASAPDLTVLPAPPPIASLPSRVQGKRHKQYWPSLESINAWGDLVRSHIGPLSDGNEPLFQIAWNSARSGPIAAQMEILAQMGEAPSGEWLRLLNRPPFEASPSLQVVLEGHTKAIRTVSMSADGTRVVTGGEDGVLRIWEPLTGKCRVVLEGHGDIITASAITPDGIKAVSGSRDGTVRVWDIESSVCKYTLSGHTNTVSGVSITPDGTVGISSSYDGTLRLWDIKQGACLRVIQGEEAWVLDVAISACGRRAVSAGRHWCLRVWDLRSHKCAHVLEGHTDLVQSVALSQDGRLAVSGSSDKSVRAWDTSTGKCLKVLKGHEAGVNAVAITADCTRAFSGSEDGTVRCWDLSRGVQLSAHMGRASIVTSIAITPDGRFLVSGGEDSELLFSDFPLRKRAPITKVVSSSVQQPLINHTGTGVLGVEDNVQVAFWDLGSGRCTRRFGAQEDWISSLSITADGRYVVSGGWETATLWNGATGVRICEFVDLALAVSSVSATSDGRLVITSDDGCNLRVWDAGTQECLTSLLISGSAVAACAQAVSPDARLLVTGDWRGRLLMWRVRTGECINDLVGHSDKVTAIRFTPDGRSILSTSNDGGLRVWDTSTGECKLVITGRKALKGVTITKDGLRVITADDNKTLKMWNIHTGECIASLTTKCMYGAVVADKSTFVTKSTHAWVNLFEIVNYRPQLPILTMVRLWLFEKEEWDSGLTAVCPYCGSQFTGKADWAGRKISCTNATCGMAITLNPFVCDNSDWLK